MRRVIMATCLTLLPASAVAQSADTSYTLNGTPTVPTATAGTNTNQIATTAFVLANASGASGTTTVAAGSNVSAATLALPGLASRTLAARAADIYNVRDYGALGSNSGQNIGARFSGTATSSLGAFASQSIAGTTPYAWMTNPAFGLTFTMQTSAAQSGAGTSLTFLQRLTGINNWAATVATWQAPDNGRDLLQAGMLVSGGCIAAGTTVSAVGRTPGAGDYGTVTLSQPTGGCASGAPITFAVSPAQLQALTIDWLGIQGAMAAAWLNTQSGGAVYIPAGTYILNHSLINGGGVVDSGAQAPNLTLRGDGLAETKLQWPVDLGPDRCAILSGGRGVALTSASVYSDMRLIGPGYTRINGTQPNAMDGLCLGETDHAEMIRVDAMHAGINGLKDHWSIRDATLTNNGYGIYFAPYSSTIGNQLIEDSGLAGNTIASIAVATTDQIDASLIKNVHTGFSPYGIYYEAKPSTVSNGLSTILSNSLLMNVYMEALGNGWIYGAGGSGSVINNSFIGGGYSDVGSQTGFALRDGSGNTLPAPAVIYVNEFQRNTMINTFWAAYGSVTDAIVEATDWAVGNSWLNDTGLVFNATSKVSALKGANAMFQNRFQTYQGDGIFRHVGAPVAANIAVDDTGYFGVAPYQDGKPFAGITASPAGAGGVVGVIGFSDCIQNAVKADASQSIAPGQPLFATSGGIAGGIDPAGSIGTAVGGSAAGSATVTMVLDPGMKAGSGGVATGLAASGNSQVTATALTQAVDQFSNVGAGTGAILLPVPVGRTVTIYNDGNSSLQVYPQLGGRIGSAGVNAPMTVAAGASANFRRMSATWWHP